MCTTDVRLDILRNWTLILIQSWGSVRAVSELASPQCHRCVSPSWTSKYHFLDAKHSPSSINSVCGKTTQRGKSLNNCSSSLHQQILAHWKLKAEETSVYTETIFYHYPICQNQEPQGERHPAGKTWVILHWTQLKTPICPKQFFACYLC